MLANQACAGTKRRTCDECRCSTINALMVSLGRRGTVAAAALVNLEHSTYIGGLWTVYPCDYKVTSFLS